MSDKTEEVPIGRILKGYSYHRIWRWAKRGVKDVNGKLQYLEVRKTPDGWATTMEKIEQFYRKLNGGE